MSPSRRQQLRNEAELIGRLAQAYHRKLSILINRMNQSHDVAADHASLRVCVEAVDMMLSNQNELARALRELTDIDVPPVRGAA